jgi:Cu(I)/Ag(I) efflux system membrane fusion protein
MSAPRTAVAMVSTAATVVVLTGLLLVQHVRHGWPFSLHHGLTEEVAEPSTGHVPAATPAHPRAEVALDPAQASALGVRLDVVRRELLSRPVRAVATVVPDEAQVTHVHTRVAGWIERLHVGTTGQVVRAGQPLAGIFSQELLASQNEYLSLLRTAGSAPRTALVDSARARLAVFGMTQREIRSIEVSGKARRLVTVVAPRGGIVLHRGISVGTAVDPSTELVTIADLSRVWVLAEIAEGDIPGIQVGTPAVLEFPASGREPIEARVTFVSPTLSERTRTLRVRFEVDNRSGALRPGIYGTATLQVAPRQALTVPRDALVDTGTVQHVFVVTAEGRFTPRTVKLGTRVEDRVEVLDGLAEGERIVASGVFLIDSESRLRASGGGTGHTHSGAPAPGEGQPPPAAHEDH